MLCPFCGSEMTAGHVRSARTVFFSEADKETGLFCIPSKDDVVLSVDNWIEPTCTAYRCKDCKKIVIEEPRKRDKFFQR